MALFLIPWLTVQQTKQKDIKINKEKIDQEKSPSISFLVQNHNEHLKMSFKEKIDLEESTSFFFSLCTK